MQRRRIRTALLWLLAAIVGMAVLWCVVGPVIRSVRVEYAINRFEARPSQARAGALVDLLEAHAASSKQGNRALALLLRPKFIMRKTYAVGQPVMVSMARPFVLGFRGVVWHEETISIDGRQGGPFSNLGWLDERPQLRLVGAYAQPGTYRVDVRCQHALGIERTSRATRLTGYLRGALSWLTAISQRWQPARTYECDFTTSTEVVIVAAEEAENVETASSPELDQAVRAAFQARRVTFHGSYPTTAGKRWWYGGAKIVYKNVPIDVSLAIALRLPDGREIPGGQGHGRRLLARAGTSGVIDVSAADFALEQPGRYDATLVLVTDLDRAWSDPAIRTIWNGTLELPISFRIDANEPDR